LPIFADILPIFSPILSIRNFLDPRRYFHDTDIINTGIYIDKIEESLEDVSCVGTTLIGIIITLLFYANNIILFMRRLFDLGKEL